MSSYHYNKRRGDGQRTMLYRAQIHGKVRKIHQRKLKNKRTAAEVQGLLETVGGTFGFEQQ